MYSVLRCVLLRKYKLLLQQEGVFCCYFIIMATIHGIQGQHAQDLIARGIIAPNPSQEHLVLVPVTQTKALIRNLLDHYGVPQTKVVNFS